MYQKYWTKLIMLGGLDHPKPRSSLWGGLQFPPTPGPGCLNSRLSPQFTRNSEYKIDHISKTINRKYLKLGYVLVSEHFTSFGTKNI